MSKTVARPESESAGLPGNRDAPRSQPSEGRVGLAEISAAQHPQGPDVLSVAVDLDGGLLLDSGEDLGELGVHVAAAVVGDEEEVPSDEVFRFVPIERCQAVQSVVDVGEPGLEPSPREKA